MESNRFEDGWKSVFGGAEAPAPDSVWSAVEFKLILAENKKMRRHILEYRRLAASLAIFALMLGALSFYDWKDSSANQIEQSILQHIPEAPVRDNNELAEGTLSTSQTKQQVIRSDAAITQIPRTNAPAHISNNNPSSQKSFEKSSTPARTKVSATGDAMPAREELGLASGLENRHDSLTQKTNDEATALSASTEPPVKIKEPEEEPTQVPVVADPETMISDNPRRGSGETLWASLGASLGAYNPGPGSAGNSTYPVGAGISGAAVSTSRATLGTSNSFGVAMTKVVRPRWVIQGGISYLRQRLGYTSNLVSTASSQPQALLAPYVTQNSGPVTTTSPYPINSVLEYISVPVQIGYRVIDRRVGLQTSAGAAADIFIQNLLQDQSGRATNFSKGAGSDSPYRSVNWAGLLSAELSYRISRQYRFSIVPGMRYSFNTALKSGSDHPSVMDIGFRLRYIMK